LAILSRPASVALAVLTSSTALTDTVDTTVLGATILNFTAVAGSVGRAYAGITTRSSGDTRTKIETRVRVANGARVRIAIRRRVSWRARAGHGTIEVIANTSVAAVQRTSRVGARKTEHSVATFTSISNGVHGVAIRSSRAWIVRRTYVRPRSRAVGSRVQATTASTHLFAWMSRVIDTNTVESAHGGHRRIGVIVRAADVFTIGTADAIVA